MNTVEAFFAAEKLAWAGMAVGGVLVTAGVARMIAPGLVERIQSRRRVGRQVSWDDSDLLDVWEPVFETGVAKVGSE